MEVHLIDGTYELFRHFFAMPSGLDRDGNEVAAARGVLGSVLGLIEAGATHVGVATDHVIESFRNRLYAGYKTSEGVPEPLMAQFPVVEEALEAMGVKVWAMVEYEADDALASAAFRAAADPKVDRVLICTPDKDLAQSVKGTRVVQFDRQRRILRDETAVVEKFGVRPESIPDFLALVGDSADGYPGLAGWGPKAASAALAKHIRLEQIPRDWRQWAFPARGAEKLAATLFSQWEDVLLYRELATLKEDAPVFESVDELAWRGPNAGFEAFCERIAAPGFPARAAAACR